MGLFGKRKVEKSNDGTKTVKTVSTTLGGKVKTKEKTIKSDPFFGQKQKTVKVQKTDASGDLTNYKTKTKFVVSLKKSKKTLTRKMN